MTVSTSKSRQSRGRIVFGSPTRYFVGDREVSKSEFDLRFPAKPLGVPLQSQTPACWPILSDALAVHPSDIPAAREDARKKGVPTEFTKDGRAILDNAGHRRKYMKAYGFFDKRSFL